MVFSENGVYVLRLEANDGEYTTSDETTVTIYPAGTLNQAPNIDAGGDKTITFPDTANLDGTVTDDGLPNPSGVVTVNWSVVSGPGTVTFTDPNNADTNVNFSAVGIYVLRLEATDGESLMDDEIIIIVNPASLSPPTS